MDPWVTLREEFITLQRELVQNDSPITRRTFFRAVCANIEGTLNYLMRIMAENAAVLTDTERLAFLERQIHVKDSGEVSTGPLHIKTKTKIKMVFHSLAKYPGGAALDLSSHEFDKLIKAVAVRNRLMHPRIDGDLSVSQEEVQHLIDGYGWYIRGYQAALKGIKREALTRNAS